MEIFIRTIAELRKYVQLSPLHYAVNTDAECAEFTSVELLKKKEYRGKPQTPGLSIDVAQPYFVP